MSSQQENLHEKSINLSRSFKVICLGAGFSGILVGIRFPQHIPNLELVIYEKNNEIGGTWFENKYPGIACDIPAHVYQYTFANNPDWSSFYAPGHEILQYLKDVAWKYDVDRYVKLRHKFERANWDEAEQQWRVSIRNLDTDERFVDTCNVLLKGTGFLNEWRWPNIPGIHDFEGPYMHSAQWDDRFDWTNKRVALIGAGSSGVQILPQIQPRAEKVTHFMKGKTWISPLSFGAKSDTTSSNGVVHTQEERQRFKDNPEQYLQYRHEIESRINQAQLATFAGTEAQKAFWLTADEFMREKLKGRPTIYQALRPEFPPGCRRLTPAPGYLEALTEDNVDFVGQGIAKIDKHGIWSENGEYYQVDAIICATGFDYSFDSHSTPFFGRRGIGLQELWTPRPESYLSLCTSQMPNLFFFIGPNGGPIAGSVVVMLEHLATYIIQCCKKLQREHIASMEVSESAQKAFQSYADRYFAKSIFTYKCKSWYKRNQEDGQVVGLWPGSAMHAEEALAHPRFEDFHYVQLPATEANSLNWLGNGMTLAQENNEKTTGYLDTVDIPKPINTGPRPKLNGVAASSRLL